MQKLISILLLTHLCLACGSSSSSKDIPENTPRRSLMNAPTALPPTQTAPEKIENAKTPSPVDTVIEDEGVIEDALPSQGFFVLSPRPFSVAILPNDEDLEGYALTASFLTTGEVHVPPKKTELEIPAYYTGLIRLDAKPSQPSAQPLQSYLYVSTLGHAPYAEKLFLYFQTTGDFTFFEETVAEVSKLEDRSLMAIRRFLAHRSLFQTHDPERASTLARLYNDRPESWYFRLFGELAQSDETLPPEARVREAIKRTEQSVVPEAQRMAYETFHLQAFQNIEEARRFADDYAYQGVEWLDRAGQSYVLHLSTLHDASQAFALAIRHAEQGQLWFDQYLALYAFHHERIPSAAESMAFAEAHAGDPALRIETLVSLYLFHTNRFQKDRDAMAFALRHAAEDESWVIALTHFYGFHENRFHSPFAALEFAEANAHRGQTWLETVARIMNLVSPIFPDMGQALAFAMAHGDKK